MYRIRRVIYCNCRRLRRPLCRARIYSYHRRSYPDSARAYGGTGGLARRGRKKQRGQRWGWLDILG